MAYDACASPQGACAGVLGDAGLSASLERIPITDSGLALDQEEVCQPYFLPPVDSTASPRTTRTSQEYQDVMGGRGAFVLLANT